MAMAERTATTSWDGDLAHGAGHASPGRSGALDELAVTWASRTERSDGKTSPEELIAAAHSSCFSMALAHGLSRGAATPPEHLEVSRPRSRSTSVDGAPDGDDLRARRSAAASPGLDQMGFDPGRDGGGQELPGLARARRASRSASRRVLGEQPLTRPHARSRRATRSRSARRRRLQEPRRVHRHARRRSACRSGSGRPAGACTSGR